jgi:hypothetical protein
MQISKSSRHSKITGDYCEALILYWLSKYGFECALIDHTGIDILARNPVSNELMGISVKGRSRNQGTEETYINLPNENFRKVDAACEIFNCTPYFALVIDAGDTIKVFIISKEKLLQYNPMGQTASGWKMTKSWLDQYKNDKEIVKIEFGYSTHHWWGH